MYISENYPPGSVGIERERLQAELDEIKERNPAFKLSCETYEALGNLTETAAVFMERLKEIFRELIEKIRDVFTPCLKEAMGWVKKAYRAYIRESAKAAGLEKCYHLAFYARKARTRKKNLKRLLENMEDEV